MNPWTIIGWLVLGLLVLKALLTFAGLVLVNVPPWVYREVMHYRTRNTPPAAIQEWREIQGPIWVARVTDSERIVLSTTHPKLRWSAGGGMSWSVTADEWRHRVRQRRGWLVGQELGT